VPQYDADAATAALPELPPGIPDDRPAPGDLAGLERWVRTRGITEVECMVADLSGIPRGKILPAHKFLSSLRDKGLRLPESVFIQTVTGGYPEDDPINIEDRDIFLVPDATTIRTVPWYEEPTAQVITDCVYRSGAPVAAAPVRNSRRFMSRGLPRSRFRCDGRACRSRRGRGGGLKGRTRGPSGAGPRTAGRARPAPDPDEKV
jgi:hypothetical protein